SRTYMASRSISRPLEIVDLGRMRYGAALDVQQTLVEQRKQGHGRDTLLFVEHPHVVTMGRNGREQHILATPEILERTGIEFYETNRGGDVTYHGPGQLVGYPILDLREWKRDVHAYFRGVEQALIDGLATFGIEAERIAERGYEGVWVNGAKIAAIGIHISRWISSHGFALNIDTDLSYFQYIVPCGLTKPVCSLRSLGCQAGREEVMSAMAASFAKVFDYELVQQLQETR
ncbi:MAG TPA: lipoyl(octanoyl) transferase LipB, partial [Bryobacteraceae bacterium]|nr:lipoyl(octanoyl) transferase LipB [Bryobacteraceae bacterium]